MSPPLKPPVLPTNTWGLIAGWLYAEGKPVMPHDPSKPLVPKEAQGERAP
jgi:hypothetical protein